MSLSDLSIERPVLTWMMILALATFGTLGFLRLGIDSYPAMEFPYVGTRVVLEGADPRTMEDEVVDVLEEAYATIEGVRHIYSQASTGNAQVILEFELEHDLDTAAQDVRDKLNVTMDKLPREIRSPAVGKADYSQFPIVYAPIASDLSETETTQYVERHIIPILESIPGAAGTELYGGRERNIRIWIDPAALRARGLAASDVLDALRREHVERPGGFVEGGSVEWALKTDAEFRSVEELGNMILSWDQEAPVRLRDVARLEDGTEDIRDSTHVDGKKGAVLGLSKQSDANTVAIVDEFVKRLDRLRPATPSGIQISGHQGFIDQSEAIREAFQETMFALVFGGLLAVFVVFVFMRRTRPTFIVAAAIPMSLITTFGMIWIFDFTLNTMTLLGLTLAIGVVIDDAIIVLENIERHREEGKDAKEAARVGTREITFAAVAATFSVAAVFIPVAFASGRMGAFLTEFGVTVSVAVIVSLFVALSLTPMLASRMPAPKDRGPDSIYQRLETWFRSLEAGYGRVLDWTLANRLKTTGVAVVAILLAVLAGSRLDGEFMPSSDSGFIVVEFSTPPGTSLEITEGIMERNEQWFMAQPEVAIVFARVGPHSMSIAGANHGTLNARLLPQDQRERSLEDFKRDARSALAQIPGQEFAIVDPMAQGRRDFQVELLGNADLEELEHYAGVMMERLQALGGFADLDQELRLGLPEARIVPDREKAAALGVDAATLAEIVQSMIGGLDVASFRDGEERHDIRMRMEPSERDSLEAVGDLWVRTRNGELVDMRNLVRIEKGASAATISRTDRQRSVEVSANFDGIALDEAVRRAQAIADEILPPHLSLRLAGDAEAMKETGQEFILMLLLSILVIYMVLAAQFESFSQPLIVMLALPFSMTGALGGLWLFDMSLSLFSMIGLLLLLGLVTKNSILLVDYANQLRDQGATPEVAIRRAAPVRMRPVLMTALSMIFGVLPAAFGIGPGAESRQPMAVSTAAGMFSSMMLTLLVVPVFYLALEDFSAWLRHRAGAGWRGGPRSHAPAA